MRLFDRKDHPRQTKVHPAKVDRSHQLTERTRMGHIRHYPRARRRPGTHPRPPLARRQSAGHNPREQDVRATSRDPPR